MVSISTVALIEPCGTPDVLLGEVEHFRPQARLEMALHLRQIEIRAGTARERFLRVVEEVQAEVDERARTPGARSVWVMCFSYRCQPRGRTMSTAVWLLSR